LLDLTQSDKELLSGMRKNNRKSIRRAERDGVTIEKSTEKAAIEEFIRLHKDTKKKHNFTPYPDDFFRKQVEHFKDDDQVLVINARYNGEVIGSAIVMFYGDMACYHHGANSIAHEKIPSAYLIQWAAIQEAKKRGLKVYNFWGVSPIKDRPHPISGVSHFKRGFGGKQFDVLHAQDMPFQISYGLNWLIETIRRKRRGYYFIKPE
jgi:lipid II:glycine glycyltransferase (peptidoglycan interpeptide bridge formation enzyme)